jgi:hypothetical protein
MREEDAPRNPDMSIMNQGFDDEVLMVGSVPFLPEMGDVCLLQENLEKTASMLDSRRSVGAEENVARPSVQQPCMPALQVGPAMSQDQPHQPASTRSPDQTSRLMPRPSEPHSRSSPPPQPIFLQGKVPGAFEQFSTQKSAVMALERAAFLMQVVFYPTHAYENCYVILIDV